jgi:hypothetical protein
MSERSGKGARRPRRKAPRTPAGPPTSAAEHAPDITLLALMEGLATAWRAEAPPPLAAYARVYPQYAGTLAAYAAELWSGEVAAREAEPPPTRPSLSAGTQGALARLFGGTAAAPIPLARLVAEQPGAYTTREAATREAPPDEV